MNIFRKNRKAHRVSDSVDVIITGLWMCQNYGAVLTSYALYKIVCSLGYKSALADHKPIFLWNKYDDHFWRFLYEQKVPIWSAATLNEQKNLARSVHTILVGSDQLWNPKYGYEYFFFLDWANADNRKISYSTSMGDLASFPKEYAERAGNYLRRFDAISVREEHSVPQIDRFFGIQASCQIDPVFLLSKEAWKEISRSNQSPLPSQYLLVYSLYPEKDMAKTATKIAREKGLSDIIYVFDASVKQDDSLTRFLRKEASRQNIRVHVHEKPDIPLWIRLFAEADFVLTASFHGTCFSLIFQRQFISIGFGETHRFESLLRLLGIPDRLTTWENCQTDAQDIDYSRIKNNLNCLRKASIQWLTQQLSEENRSTEKQLLNEQIFHSLPPRRSFSAETKRWLWIHYPRITTFLHRIKK